MKKFVAVLTAAAMLTSLSACGASASTASSAAESTAASSAAADSTADATYKIAVVQQLDHASLDEIRTAIEAELDAKAAEKGITIEYKDFNGQNDATTLNQIEAKTIGLLYSNSEANSTTPIAEAKAYLDAKGIAYVEKTGNTNDEIMTAANSLVGQVDAVFTPTDNVVMAAAAAVSETLTKAGIPFYTGADSFVTAGAFATCGVNYTELGTYTADMALDVLETGTVPEYHVMDGGIITVNTETAAALNLDYSAFHDLAGTVVEVETAAE